MENIPQNPRPQIQNTQGVQNSDNQTQTLSKPVKTYFGFKPKLVSLYQKIDSKLTKIMPDPKLRKVAIFSSLGLVLFFTLTLLLGIVVTLTKPRSDPGYFLQKPAIIQSSPVAEQQKTRIQTELVDLKSQIDKLMFPPSELSQPQLEVDIKIE